MHPHGCVLHLLSHVNLASRLCLTSHSVVACCRTQMTWTTFCPRASQSWVTASCSLQPPSSLSRLSNPSSWQVRCCCCYLLLHLQLSTKPSVLPSSQCTAFISSTATLCLQLSPQRNTAVLNGIQHLHRKPNLQLLSGVLTLISGPWFVS